MTRCSEAVQAACSGPTPYKVSFRHCCSKSKPLHPPQTFFCFCRYDAHALAQDCCSTCLSGGCTTQPVEPPAAPWFRNSRTAAQQQQLPPLLLIFALAAETVLLDSTDMKSSPHLLRAWFSMTSTRRQQPPSAMLSITRQTFLPLNCWTIKHLNLTGNKNR